MWKDIPGYEGLYKVNEYGDILSSYTNKILKYSISKDGYKQYNLYKNKKAYIITAHRAVALAFIPNPDSLPLVNHKDENKLNCFVENLEWCDNSYNVSYNGNRSAQTQYKKYAKEFYVYDLDMKLLRKFKGVRKFCRENRINFGNFSAILLHNTKNPNNLYKCKNFYPIYNKIS